MKLEEINMYDHVFYNATLMVVIGIGDPLETTNLRLILQKDYSSWIKNGYLHTIYKANAKDCFPANSDVARILYGS